MKLRCDKGWKKEMEPPSVRLLRGRRRREGETSREAPPQSRVKKTKEQTRKEEKKRREKREEEKRREMREGRRDEAK